MEWGGAGPGGLRRSVTRSRKQTASRAWVLWTLWFDTVFRGLQTGSPRTGGDGEGAPRIARKVGCCWLCGSTRPAKDSGRLTTNGVGSALYCAEDRSDELGAWGFLVRRDRPKTPGRLTTNGVGPTIGSEAWVLWPVWFDATVRRPAGRLTTNGVGPATGSEAWVLGLCGSTRAAGYGAPAHHERGRADDWLGGLGAGGCVVRRDRPKTAGRLTTNGVGAGDWLGRLGVEGCVVRHDRPKTAWSAHHERGRGRRLARKAWVPRACVVRHDSFDRLRTGSSKTAGRLTTNGVGPASLGGYRNVRSGVSWPGCRARASWRWPASQEEISGRPSGVRQEGCAGCGAYDHGIRKSGHLVGR